MKSRLLGGFLTIAVAAMASSPAFAAFVVSVPGTSNPYLAGMPNGTVSTRGGVSDQAPAQSPVLVPVTVVGGASFQFSATGTTSFAPSGPFDGPDGDIAGNHFGFVSHNGGAENGISDIRAPANALLGVFLGAGQPNLNPAPAALNFATFGTDFPSLSPALQQLFFIGDGLTSSLSLQTFIAPSSATRLYLGTMDGFGWFNNAGAFQVTVNPAISVPEPASLVLFSFGLVGLGFAARRNRNA